MNENKEAAVIDGAAILYAELDPVLAAHGSK
jgi:hypothetical protein